jgi:hypothetical protein
MINMEYVLLNVNFSGNDDAQVEGFIAREVESQKEWQKQIKQAVKEELKDGDGFLEIYHSDNCSTPFESVEEVLGTFTMKTITKEEFLVLSNLFGSSDNVVSYGHTDSYLDYYPPVVKEKVIVLHGEVVEDIKLYFKDDTSDKVYNIQIEKVAQGYVVNYQFGKNGGKLKEGTQTDSPVPYENAKEIFDAAIKFKNKYTTDPSGIKPTTPKIK